MMDIKSFVAEARNEYTYTSGGQKLKVVQKWNPNFNTSPVIGSAINTSSLTKTKTTDYVGNKIYEDNSLKRILIDGGYIENNTYHFYITDHLGNNRVVANANGTAIQKNHYYPFGTTFAETSTDEQGKQPYKYNNKELDQAHGLNWYDYSARYKDDWRFTTVDPMAEKYYSWSPYVYCMNNPLKYIDPTGCDTIYINNRGENVKTIASSTDVFYTVDKNGNIINSKSFDSKIVNGIEKSSKGADIYSINNNTKDATSLFEFLSDNTSVEWGHELYEKEDKQINLLTTSHKEDGVSVGSKINDLLNDDYNLIMINHNHPSGANYPSGLIETGGYNTGDLSGARTIKRALRKDIPEPSYNIYIPKSQRTISDRKYFPYYSNQINHPRFIAP